MTYPGTNGSEAGQVSSPAGRYACSAGASVWLAGVLAFVLLIGAGVAYRVAASRLRWIRDNPPVLPMPLSTIPTQIGSWTGREVPVGPELEEYLRANFADDYVNRQYTDSAAGTWAGVYVVYCSSYPSGLLGHRPDVCFPANGWIRDYRTPTEITTRSGQKIPCLSHQFHKPPPAYEQVSVLSFYVLNGQITLRERDFSGIFDRAPNISGDPALYVAQVQISSALEPSVKAAARDLVDTILTFLPDRHGYVKAASSFGQAGTGQGTDANH